MDTTSLFFPKLPARHLQCSDVQYDFRVKMMFHLSLRINCIYLRIMVSRTISISDDVHLI